MSYDDRAGCCSCPALEGHHTNASGNYYLVRSRFLWSPCGDRWCAAMQNHASNQKINGEGNTRECYRAQASCALLRWIHDDPSLRLDDLEDHFKEPLGKFAFFHPHRAHPIVKWQRIHLQSPAMITSRHHDCLNGQSEDIAQLGLAHALQQFCSGIGVC